MLNGFVEPTGSVEFKVLPGQKPGRPQPVYVVGIEFVSRQHLSQHLIIAFIAIERLDNPVSPMPNVLLRVTNFGPESPPVAVAPYIHPMPSPTFAVLGTIEQAGDDFVVSIGR